MADECDQAQTISDRYLNGEIAHIRSNAARPGVGAGLKPARTCEDCGEIIPAARIEAAPGCTRCIKCQTAYEEEN